MEMPMSELERLHDKLRRAEFDNELLEEVVKHDSEWRRLEASDALAYVQGRSVVAETFDYFGRYGEAAESLSACNGQELNDFVRKGEDVPGSTPPLLKRRIWLHMSLAQVDYRNEHYDDAVRKLDTCEQAVELLHRSSKQLCGTKSRIAYVRGQVLRQRGEYREARQSFAESITWARRRFVVETPFADLSEPSNSARTFTTDQQVAFDQARLLASCGIGRGQAMGLGWIEGTLGNLAASEMLLNAGYSLLRCTGDWIHRAYCILLLGVVLRARARDNEGLLLHEAKDLMLDAKRGLCDHPYRLRAAYELSQVYVRLGDASSSRREIDEAIKYLPQNDDSRKSRWECNIKIVQSRIERMVRNYDRAERFAKEAIRLASGRDTDRPTSGYKEAWVEARIAHGEALLALSTVSEKADSRRQLVEQALKNFALARDRSAANPKVVAVCRLHSARAHLMVGSVRDAWVGWSAWDDNLCRHVEHGFVQSLADDVKNRIDAESTFFVSQDFLRRKSEEYLEIERGQNDDVVIEKARKWFFFDETRDQLDRFLIDQAVSLKHGKLEAAADFLGLHAATIRRRLHPKLPKEAPSGKKPKQPKRP